MPKHRQGHTKHFPNTGHTKKGMENHTILMGDFSTFLKKERHSPLSLIRDASCIFERVSNVSHMYSLSIYPRTYPKRKESIPWKVRLPYKKGTGSRERWGDFSLAERSTRRRAFLLERKFTYKGDLFERGHIKRVFFRYNTG